MYDTYPNGDGNVGISLLNLTFRNSKFASGIFGEEDFFDSYQKTHLSPACRFSRL